MDESEARDILSERLGDYRRRSYEELSAQIGEPELIEIVGPSGARYQLEIESLWDDKRGGAVRVMGSIDDGSFRRAFMPFTDDFIIAPDGSFVGE
jgi:hypothetical protein